MLFLCVFGVVMMIFAVSLILFDVIRCYLIFVFMLCWRYADVICCYVDVTWCHLDVMVKRFDATFIYFDVMCCVFDVIWYDFDVMFKHVDAILDVVCCLVYVIFMLCWFILIWCWSYVVILTNFWCCVDAFLYYFGVMLMLCWCCFDVLRCHFDIWCYLLWCWCYWMVFWCGVHSRGAAYGWFRLSRGYPRDSLNQPHTRRETTGEPPAKRSKTANNIKIASKGHQNT